MPTICMFYGIIVRMLFMDIKQHNLPHIHVEYQGMKAVIEVPGGTLLEGELPAKNCDFCRLGLISMKMNLWLTGRWL